MEDVTLFLFDDDWVQNLILEMIVVTLYLDKSSVIKTLDEIQGLCESVPMDLQVEHSSQVIDFTYDKRS